MTVIILLRLACFHYCHLCYAIDWRSGSFHKRQRECTVEPLIRYPFVTAKSINYEGQSYGVQDKRCVKDGCSVSGTWVNLRNNRLLFKSESGGNQSVLVA